MASSLLNTGQQVGGSIGLALLGTVAWTVVANSTHAQAAARRAAGHPGRTRAARWPRRSTTTRWPSASPAAFLVAAGIALLTLIITIAAIRVRRADLAAAPQPEPAAPAHPAPPQ